MIDFRIQFCQGPESSVSLKSQFKQTPHTWWDISLPWHLSFPFGLDFPSCAALPWPVSVLGKKQTGWLHQSSWLPMAVQWLCSLFKIKFCISGKFLLPVPLWLSSTSKELSSAQHPSCLFQQTHLLLCAPHCSQWHHPHLNQGGECRVALFW